MIAVKHHAILQARNQALPMDVPTVPHNAIMVVHHVPVPVQVVVVETVAQQHARVAVKHSVLQRAASSAQKDHIANDYKYKRT